MGVDVTILAPAYNEEAAIERFVTGVLSILEDRWELLVVDDGSTDETGRIVGRLAGAHAGLRIVTHERNRGLGAALRTGFEAAAGDVVVTIDADLSHPLELIARLVSACDEADAAFASRFILGGGMNGVPPARRWISQVGNAVFRVLLRSPVRDLTTGFRAYRLRVIRSTPVESEGFEVQLEIAMKLVDGGHRIVELPFVLEPRLAGSSKMRYLGLVPRYGSLLLRLLWMRWRPGRR